MTYELDSKVSKCMFCGNTDTGDTRVVEGYTILNSCEDCEEEIIMSADDEEDEDIIFIGLTHCQLCNCRIWRDPEADDQTSPLTCDDCEVIVNE